MNEIRNLSRLRQGLAAAATVAIGSRIARATSFDTPSLGAFALAPKDVCTLTCAQTIGPCYYDARLIREDITEGKAGMPTRISFLIVDADTCKPVSNAAIDIWHTDASGVYSAPINAMCNPGDTLARQQTFARGVQMTSADGRAHYPGWYDSSDNILGGKLIRIASYISSTKLYGCDVAGGAECGRGTNLDDEVLRMKRAAAVLSTFFADCTTPQTLVCGAAPSTESLGASDCMASDTSYYDAYQFTGRALDPHNKPVADNDDVTESNTNSRLTFTLTSSGTWTVIANTLKAGASGDYAIALTSSACAVTAPAGPRRRTASHE